MIAAGHPPAAVWKYTPRQIAGFLFFVAKREQRERADRISTGFAAARGDPKELQKTLKEMTRE